MKNYLILFSLLFSMFIIPSDVLAAGEVIYVPYNNVVSEYSFEIGESLKNTLYNDPNVTKEDNDKCMLIYDITNSSPYQLICSSSLDTINLLYRNNFNSFFLSLSDIRLYRFSSDYVYTSSSTVYVYITTNSFDNIFLYSDFDFKFIENGGSFDNIYFYDLNDSSKIYGQFNTSDLYTYKDFYLTESNEDVVVFQDNDIHNISKLILGDNIPEEYSFVYTISDYLLVLLFVGIIISPIAIIIKIMRW